MSCSLTLILGIYSHTHRLLCTHTREIYARLWLASSVYRRRRRTRNGTVSCTCTIAGPTNRFASSFQLVTAIHYLASAAFLRGSLNLVGAKVVTRSCRRDTMAQEGTSSLAHNDVMSTLCRARPRLPRDKCTRQYNVLICQPCKAYDGE